MLEVRLLLGVGPIRRQQTDGDHAGACGFIKAGTHWHLHTDPHSESLYKDLLIFVSHISSVHKQIKLL